MCKRLGLEIDRGDIDNNRFVDGIASLEFVSNIRKDTDQPLLSYRFCGRELIF